MANDNKLVNLADLKEAFNTLKTNASQSAAGLMSATDKTKLDGIASGATANVGTVTSVATGVGLTGGTITGSGTLKAKLRSETALTIDSAAATTTSGRVYPVAVDKTGYLAVNVPWTDSKPVTSVAGKTGAVTLTNSDVGLGNVENKSSATIRGELTKANVTTALGYTPPTASDVSKREILVVSKNGVNSLPCTLETAEIETDMVCVKAILSNPAAQISNWSINTDTAGKAIVYGSINGSTDIVLYLMKSNL